MQESALLALAARVESRRIDEQYMELHAAGKSFPLLLERSLSAFANQDKGGILLFGFDEKHDFSVCGVYDSGDLSKKLYAQAKQMEPIVSMKFTKAVYKGKEICCAEILPATDKQRPCFYKRKGKYKGAYRRIGRYNTLMSDYEVYRYEAKQQHIKAEARPIKQDILDMLWQREAMQAYIEKQCEKYPERRNADAEEKERIFGLRKDGQYTLAALLFFYEFPQMVLPRLCVEIVAADETKRIEGNIAMMLQNTLRYCEQHVQKAAFTDIYSSLRQAIIYALLQRDYSVYTELTPICISLSKERIEVRVPGSSPKITKDKQGNHVMQVHNPNMKNIFYALYSLNGINENSYDGKNGVVSFSIFKDNDDYHVLSILL